jgi:predicted O-linked N-acetylglucosamine transferase (SPINDLY family)
MSKQTGSRAFHNERLRKQRHKVDAAFAQALALHQRGAIADAEARYREIVDKFPTHFESLHHLAIAASQTGRHEEAVRLFDDALAVEPRSSSAHSNRGVALHALKRFEEAVASFDLALALAPDHADALSNRGNALAELGRFEEAVASYDGAVALNPSFAGAWSNRATALKELRRFEEAVASCEKALALHPANADALSNRGFALNELKRFDEALADFDKALALKPDFAEAWLGRGNVFLETRALGEALACYQKALEIRPDYFKALLQLAACHGKRGDMANVITHYDKALAIQPDFADAISNRIFSLDFIADAAFAEHQAARREWWRQVGAKIAAASPSDHDNDLDSSRRLVIGYVSSDFNRHSAATAFKPVLAHHDRSRFHVICYSCSVVDDDLTQQFRLVAETWREAAQWSNERLAAQIRHDKNDILVDLSGHSAGHRLQVFARKPAPVQVTAWGHATGTGLPAIDYLFSDPVAIPAEARPLFAETIYDLPCLITMERPSYEIAQSDPPMLSRGDITFGSFNRVAKLSEETIAVWAALLRTLPRARLLMKDTTLDDHCVRDILASKFARHGVSGDRIEFRGSTSREEHLGAFRDVDIALDPFPQNGGISTWEALHMGVPVVAKLGNSLPSRLSGAILSAIGLTDWVAETVEDYRTIALKFAAMPDYLQAVRHELPARIAASPAGNSAAYTRAVEEAYRTMWRTYVAQVDAGSARGAA